MKFLLEFDASWTQYEQFYVYELMVIEGDARRFVTDAIRIEQEMQNIEIQMSNEGKSANTIMAHQTYNDKR